MTLTFFFFQGIANLRATQEVIGTQRLTYKFPFSEFTFETDIGVVVLSEGKTKSAFFQVRRRRRVHVPRHG
jgi:hypothetical protein